jgi:RimJ/RimL family protein N-acetyltransferase
LVCGKIIAQLKQTLGLVPKVLKGKKVSLKAVEREDVSLLAKWWSDPQYMGEYQDIRTLSSAEIERITVIHPEWRFFVIIRKNDGAKVGHVNAWLVGKTREIGFALVPTERRKGYGTEAVQIIVNYLFQTTDTVRIQARTDVRNTATGKALTKGGFAKEGTMRKSGYSRGVYGDEYLYSILREEWKEPKIYTKTR